MGALLCHPHQNSLNHTDTTFDDIYRKISNVAPHEFMDKSQASIIQPIEKFYYIPKEESMDKLIENLDEAPILSDKDTLLLHEMLAELYGLKKKYGFLELVSQYALSSMTSQPGHKQSDLNQTFTMTLQEYDKGTDFKRSRTFGAMKGPFQEAFRRKGTFLMVGVYNAKFMHEEIIQKHSLQKPYVVVKVYLKQVEGTPKRRDKSSPPAKAEVKSYMTRKCEDVVKPNWDELFEYPIKVKEEEKNEKFALYSVGVSLFYTRGNTNDVWQVGEEQHFSLSSLKDQKMQVKIVDYKDVLLKGVLARVSVKLQLVHDVELLRERLCQDIDVRIEKLMKVKERNLPQGGNIMSDVSFLNSIATGNNQSVPSVYSMTGLKENEYFFS